MDIYLIAIIVLFVLAISDLMVGVSNDAVNFLNSAIGSKVAPRYVIMIVSSIGIMIGTTFSSGLMEVARNGIFNPNMFYFPEIMIIFLAVMITDVLLLDLYNTFGLPTSTTVSIVFELLGAAVAIATIKVIDNGAGSVIDFINTSKALTIVSGILISVVVAFSVGAIVQFFIRLIFTFDYEKRVKRYGAIFGSFTLTAITYFILNKGLKGASFITPEAAEYFQSNMNMLMLYNFIFWGIVFQLFIFFTKVNILKPIVLAGTFALALAFAANDLVNFIGVPLAGLSAYQVSQTVDNPLTHLMVELTGKVSTPTILLLLAGVVMVLTLWKSKKAQSVTKTEVNLGRQDEGFERFESSLLSRVIVRMGFSTLEFTKKITPKIVQRKLSERFDITQSQLAVMSKKDAPSFDMLRASVNLLVASVLISFATSLKLPLSTTYVTFMVAMGSSLSDKAWGRESAVYRINGVITVIGGWFFTAFMAFTASAFFAVIIYYGELIALIVLLSIAGYIILKTHVFHKKREKEEEEIEFESVSLAKNSADVIATLFSNIQSYFSAVAEHMTNTLEGLYTEDRTKLREEKNVNKRLKKQTNLIVNQIISSVKLLKNDEVKEGRRYGKIIASIQEIQAYLKEMNQLSFEHIDNNHGKPEENQISDLKALNELILQHINKAGIILTDRNFELVEDFHAHFDTLRKAIHEFDENELVRIREKSYSARNSMLFLNILSDLDNISNHVNELLMVCRKNYLKTVITKPPTSIVE